MRFHHMRPTDFAEMEKWLSGDNLHDVTVQFTNSPPYAPEILAAVNQLCRRYGDKVQVNFQWANIDGSFTGTELRQLPDLVTMLKRIVVLHCIRLARFHGLRDLPTLENFAVVECPVKEEQLRHG